MHGRMVLSKFVGSLLGLAVGDSLGARCDCGTKKNGTSNFIGFLIVSIGACIASFFIKRLEVSVIKGIPF